ncbi:EamA family transporter [Candidatus Sumerlaeota bacterium]|nr:EamA family transporter [Candidatus Sumerlaeota bacterium]
MQLIAIILVALSAFIHAGWNLASKRQHPSAAFFLITSLTGILLFSPILFMYGRTALPGFSVKVWTFLVATGFFMALYYISLAGAYRSGELSVAYPLARSSPVIVVSVVAFLLGRGAQVSFICVLGIILVVGGCFLIPMQKFREFRLNRYLNATCGLALLAAIGTSGYSIIDDEALRTLRNNPDISLNTTQVTLLYSFCEALAVSLWLFLFIAVRRNGRLDMRETLRTKTRHAILAGLAIHITYAIVLVSLAFAKNVSYVVGFRQLSIPLGAVFGIVILKEQPHIPKIMGVAIMFIGLLLVAMG